MKLIILAEGEETEELTTETQRHREDKKQRTEFKINSALYSSCFLCVCVALLKPLSVSSEEHQVVGEYAESALALA